MQLRKEILLLGSLILLSVCLLFAAGISRQDISECDTQQIPVKCCQHNIKVNTESPWNFITRGILHLSV